MVTVAGVIGAVHSTLSIRTIARAHVPVIPAADRRLLMEDVRQAGFDHVLANRTSLATRLRDLGDEEYAQRAAREAAFLLDTQSGLSTDFYA